jgi:putative heme-binding domain-containing protein
MRQSFAGVRRAAILASAPAAHLQRDSALVSVGAVNPRAVIAGAALLAATGISFAAEPWADPRLTVTNQMYLWIDVSRQAAGRGAAGLTPLQSWSDAPDVLLDASGQRRHLTQPLLASRPRFRQEFNGAMLSFDGTNDFLAGSGSNRAESNLTVFLVAAPRSNAGYFRGFFSFNRTGQNDYTSGLNLDLGGLPSGSLAVVNAEGAGGSGQANLLARPHPFPRWHVFTLAVGRGADAVKLFLDGQPQRTRDRAAGSSVRMDDITLGARRYSNSADRPHAQGFFDGHFAEWIVFNRSLSDAERATVEGYLTDKYGALLRGLTEAPVREGAVPLVTVTNPPPVQVHFPGFSARELPLDLSNINNLRYRPDGKLVAVAYDGRIWLLSDTDGDGAEDKAEPFWDKQTIRAPIGADLTPLGYARGQGVFLAGKGKVSLIIDTNRDDRADEEIPVASWTEPSQQHGVDGLGVAVGPDGSVYFSLGAASFTEPFLIDRTTGQARYRTTMDRGTIQRVTPDFSRREAVCTGIRFAVGLAFHPNGDLFCTDQEGATWRHDGNPFDELLHIEQGRHYGFPPRHPKHLPNVFDEPSVFDYGPQHQSTCGLQFNRAGNVSFGPAAWKDEAIVAGYSRGKLWRTKLVKTSLGYVAQTHLLATLQALTVEATVSPRGDLIVATHSGQPDWGSGPNGKGKLWRVRYEDTNAPQPVLAWNESPTELRVAFDRAVDPERMRDLAKNSRIDSGTYVYPADRFETIRPGYQVVYDQLSAPRFTHEILSTQLSPDRRTVTFVTRPRTSGVNYAVTVPTMKSEIDLLAGLTGVEATWKSTEGNESWSGWLPHVDLAVAREFTRGSAAHEQLFALLAKPGALTLRGQLDLYQMLQPAIQPGAKIDWERPSETVSVRFASEKNFNVRLGAQRVNGSTASALVRSPGERWHSFEIAMTTGGTVPKLTTSWSTDEDSRARAFPLRRFYVPWATPATEKPASPGERVIPEIAGGNWLRGQKLFFGEKLACAKCHVVRGEGIPVGPELSNLIHRDYASVRKDIELPNAALNPDHIASVLEMIDGDLLNGIIQSDKPDIIKVAMASGVSEAIPRAKVKSIQPAQLSLMPDGLWAAMTESERRDLMTFLLTVPLEPYAAEPVIQGHARPEPRKRSEFAHLLPTLATPHQHGPEPGPSAPNLKPLRIVLCAAEKDPGHNFPGLHDYPIWRERWSRLLGMADRVTVEPADQWPSAEQWKNADVVAFFSHNPGWNATRSGDLDAFLARGGGLIYLHFAVNGGKDWEPLSQRIGLAWGPGAKFRHGAEQLVLKPHEITRGLPASIHFTDETYWNMRPGGDYTPLGTVVEEGEPRPQIWIREHRQGRVFASILGHFTWTFDDPFYRVLLLRGLAWTARQPLDRFDDLILVGARVQEQP